LSFEIPEKMKSKGRAAVQQFDSQEKVYRRLPPILWDFDSEEIELNAIPLPEMSVFRERFTEKMEWILIDPDHKKIYSDWGILTFKVKDIPESFLHKGIYQYNFKPVHQPQKNNYPHSVVRAYEDGKPILERNQLDEEAHLRFRERLFWKVRVIRKPTKISE